MTNAIVAVAAATPISTHLSLTFLADWHVGSGAGIPGSIDRVVQRDADGLPFVPAKTLTGIWRDACELAAQGLDAGLTGQPWAARVERLFGCQPALRHEATLMAPVAALLSVGPARLPALVRGRLSITRPDSAALRAALTLVKPGIKIDADSGTVEKDHLRFIEMARQGLTLTAEISLDLGQGASAQDWLDAQAILYAGVLLIDRLGGKRRRGNGRCKAEIAFKLLPEVLLSHLEASPRQDWLINPDGPDKTPAAAIDNTGDWYAVHYAITLQQPASIPYRTLGNVGKTLDHVPGTAMFAWLSRQLGEPIQQALQAGSLRCLPLYLSVGKKRGLPAPLVFARRKDPSADGQADGFNTLPWADGHPEGVQIKPLRGAFVALADNSVFPDHAKPAMILRAHNTIDDQRQRPTAEIGGLYSYEALQEGQVFRGTILARGALAQSIYTILAQAASGERPCPRFGQAKKDDYGRASLWGVTEPQRVAADIKPATTAETLTLWCLSDLIVRDHRLGAGLMVEAAAEALTQALQRQNVSASLQVCDQSRLRTHVLEGWNVTWGLPRGGLLAISRGSVLVFKLEIPCAPETYRAALSAIMAEGLGERRAEGFGDIRLNAPCLEKKYQEAPPVAAAENPVASEPITTTVLPAEYAIIERAALRQEIERLALIKAEDADWRTQSLGLKAAAVESTPPMSQLGRVRAVLRQSGDQWVARDGETIGTAKIGKLFAKPSDVWELLGLKADDSLAPFRITAKSADDLRLSLQDHAVRAVLMAAMRAHKRHCDRLRLEQAGQSTAKGGHP